MFSLGPAFAHAAAALLLLWAFLNIANAALISGAVAEVPVAGRNVLILFSNQAELPANQEISRGIAGAFNTNATGPLSIYSEFLDAARFQGTAQERGWRHSSLPNIEGFTSISRLLLALKRSISWSAEGMS